MLILYDKNRLHIKTNLLATLRNVALTYTQCNACIIKSIQYIYKCKVTVAIDNVHINILTSKQCHLEPG